MHAEGVAGPQYLKLVSEFVSSHYVKPSGKDKAKPGSGPPQTTSKPTLPVHPTACIRDKTRHTPVPYRDPRYGKQIGTKTPSNPDCDLVDPEGFDTAERLWLFQNKKHRRHYKKKQKNYSKKNLECWDYESCFDHCRDVKKHDRGLRRILIGVIGAVGGLAILGMITKALLKKRKKHKKKENAAPQAKKKWGKEAQPASASGQHLDGAVNDTTDNTVNDTTDGTADGTADSTVDAAAAADEERARRAAAMFMHAFNGAVMHRRDAIASGSETTPEEYGSVTRRAS